MGREDKQRRRDKRRAKRGQGVGGHSGAGAFGAGGPNWTSTFSVPVRDGVPDYGGTDPVFDDASIREIADETATEGRALLSNHPAVRLGARLHNPEINMSVFSPDPDDDDGTTEALPVLLFEPRRMLGGTNPHTGASTELQVESICTHGFKRWPPLAASLEVAPGWTTRRHDGGVELRDAGHGLWARAEITPDPQWLSAAASQGTVLAVYGPKLGVRLPPNLPAAAYTDQTRHEELREARRYGLVAAALTSWAA